MHSSPDWRRRGVASEILSRLVESARAGGCGVMQVTASDAGTLLYDDFGFSCNVNFRQLAL